MSVLKKNSFRSRNIIAGLRDSWLLVREFSGPLFVFLIAEIGGGLLFYQLSSIAEEPIGNRLEAVYQVLGLTFFQPIDEFPQAWYLEIFYFIMPVVGLVILCW